MRKLAFVFPGQGAQTTGMAQDFYDKFNSSKKVFEAASNNLGFDICRLIFDNDKTIDLGITENTQPAILTASYAMLKPLLDEGIVPDFTAGLSLGEYTAHVCAASISFEDAVKIVQKRGKFMQEAVPIGVGTMAAIIGLERELVLEACCEASDIGIVQAANFNSPGQIVISGAVNAVQKACDICKIKGAKRAIILPVSAPFHSSLLINAAINLSKELESLKINEMKYGIVSNVTADIIDHKEQIKDLLIKQVTSPVYWWDSVVKMINEGVDTFIEIGPGKTLTGFLKKIDPNITGYSITNVEEFENVINELK